MTLFSVPDCPHCHRVRLVLAEKGINVEIYEVDPADPPEDLIDLNPYHTTPTLVDRDLVLYDAGVISDFLDERYPHPPLMPVDPVSRARLRLALFRIGKDWYQLADALQGDDTAAADAARKELGEQLTAGSEVFSASKYFLSDELSLVDCALAPLLWRLPAYGVKLGPKAKAVQEYADNLFEMPSFTDSLSEVEREMR